MLTVKNNTNGFMRKLQPLTCPNILDSIIYLLIPTYLILNMIPITRGFLPRININIIKFLIALFGATYAYKNLEPYIKRVDYNTTTTLKVSIKLLIADIVVTWLILFVVGRDPQNLNTMVLTDYQFFSLLLELPFTAIGEEVLKVLMLFAFIRLFKPLKNIGLFLAILASSAVFGLLHINYNYSNSINILLAIGVTAIPSLVFVLYYKSIIPGIIIHFLNDLIAFAAHSQNYYFIVPLFQIVWSLGFMIWIFTSGKNKKYKSRLN